MILVTTAGLLSIAYIRSVLRPRSSYIGRTIKTRTARLWLVVTHETARFGRQSSREYIQYSAFNAKRTQSPQHTRMCPNKTDSNTTSTRARTRSRTKLHILVHPLTALYRDHPLALYVFTRDPAFKENVFSRTQSGAALANEVLLHIGGTSFIPSSSLLLSDLGSYQLRACPSAGSVLVAVSAYSIP